MFTTVLSQLNNYNFDSLTHCQLKQYFSLRLEQRIHGVLRGNDTIGMAYRRLTSEHVVSTSSLFIIYGGFTRFHNRYYMEVNTIFSNWSDILC